jgi:hypothetical protein
MRMPSTRLMVFNAAAVLVALAAVLAVVRSFLVTTAVAPCSDRYQTSMTFPLERNGALLTATDIQARTGGRDSGLIENLEVISLKRGPGPAALSIALPKGSAAPNSSVVPKGGISFSWQPRSLRDQAAVCLSYQIFLPGDFDFNLGGALPGILGRADQSNDHFLVQPAWRYGGTIGVTNFVTLAGRKWKQVVDGEGQAIPRGRWVKLDQEVVLNGPELENGVLRLWLDGVLAIDKADFVYRNKAEVGIGGVAADVYYSGEDATSRSPADAKVLMSPFELRWQ